MSKFVPRILTVSFFTILGACGVEDGQSAVNEAQPGVVRQALSSERPATASADHLSKAAQAVIEQSTELSAAIKDIREQDDDQLNASYTCTAFTTCNNGVRISCSATGVRCSSSFVARTSVYCEAWNSSGAHVWASRRC